MALINSNGFYTKIGSYSYNKEGILLVSLIQELKKEDKVVAVETQIEKFGPKEEDCGCNDKKEEDIVVQNEVRCTPYGETKIELNLSAYSIAGEAGILDEEFNKYFSLEIVESSSIFQAIYNYLKMKHSLFIGWQDA